MRCKNGYKDIIEYLIRAGAQCAIKNTEGDTPLDSAETIKLHGHDRESVAKAETALETIKHLARARYLVSRGAYKAYKERKAWWTIADSQLPDEIGRYIDKLAHGVTPSISPYYYYDSTQKRVSLQQN